MASQEYLFGLVDSRGKIRRPPVVGMQFLHQRPMRPRDIVARRAFAKPQDFIGFLLRHLPRAPRPPLPPASPPPFAARPPCPTPPGKAAARFRPWGPRPAGTVGPPDRPQGLALRPGRRI